MKPVVQEEVTGFGIAATATILRKSYSSMKKITNKMGIHASDESLWPETHHVRKMLSSAEVKISDDEIPFESWSKLPKLALLSIKYHQENGRNFWHWVVFKREDGKEVVFDSAAYLNSNIRTDFDSMQPKWFIEVYND